MLKSRLVSACFERTVVGFGLRGDWFAIRIIVGGLSAAGETASLTPLAADLHLQALPDRVLSSTL